MTKRSKAGKKVKSITFKQYYQIFTKAMLDEVYKRYANAHNLPFDKLKSAKHTKPLKLKKRGLK